MAILGMSATLPFTHNRFGLQMDLSKGRTRKSNMTILNCRVSVLPALCTDLRVEGTMKDRKGKKIRK